MESERDNIQKEYETEKGKMNVEVAEMRKEMQLMRESFDGLRTAIIGGVAAIVLAGIVSTVIGLGIHP